MFEEMDFENSSELEKRRAELVKQLGEDEADMFLMREANIADSVKKNARQLAANEEHNGNLSDNGSLVDDELGKFVEEEVIEENQTEVIEETSEELNEIEESEDDVNSESDTPQVNDAWLKEKEALMASIKEQEDARKLQEGLLIKMLNELDELKKKPVEQVKEEPVVEVKPRVNKDDLKKKVKEAVEKLSYAEEDNASDILADAILSVMSEEKPQVIKQSLDESTLDELLAKRDQKLYAQRFEKARDTFFQSKEGKEVLGNEDLLDLFTVKFNRLQNSGEHLNPEDLFVKTYEVTTKVNKTSSSTANKPVPKVADSLKEDVIKSEEAKKQAVKPTGSSSNAGKPVESKKYDPIATYNEMLKATTGQTI